MTTLNHTHPGASLPYSRPRAETSAADHGAWRDLLVTLVVALFVVAAAIAVIALTSSEVPTATVHHGGAHGRAGVLFRQQLSGPLRATESGIARKGAFGRAHWQQTIGGVTASTAAAGIAGEQMSGPMTLDKLRLARHGVFGRTAAGSNGSSAAG